jgi:hypothetical protein
MEITGIARSIVVKEFLLNPSLALGVKPACYGANNYSERRALPGAA